MKQIQKKRGGGRPKPNGLKLLILLILLFISVTSVYSTDLTTTISSSDTFEDPTTVSITQTVAGNTYGANLDGSSTLVTFLDDATIDVNKTNTGSGTVNGLSAANGAKIEFTNETATAKLTVENAGTGNTYGVITSAGSEITFAGNADITVKKTNLGAGDVYGVFTDFNTASQINFTNPDANIKLNVINEGTGLTYGIRARSYTSSPYSSMTFNGITEINIKKGAGAGAVYGISVFQGPTISFNNDVKLDIKNAGTGTVFGVFASDQRATINFAGNTNIKVTNTGSVSADRIYGMYSGYASNIVFADTSVLKLEIIGDKAQNINGILSFGSLSSVTVAGYADISIKGNTDTNANYIEGLAAGYNNAPINFTNTSDLILNIVDTGIGYSFGAYVYQTARITLDGNTTINVKNLGAGEAYSLYVEDLGSIISINASKDKTTKITGDIYATTSGIINVNFTDADSYLRGLMNNDDGGAINILLAGGGIWQPTGDTNSMSNANLTIDGGRVDLAWWENQKYSRSLSRASALNFREVTVSNAALNNSMNLIVNSDIEELAADKFIVNNLLASSSDPFTTNVLIGYDPVVEKYTAQAIMGPVNIEVDDLIPVMEVNSDLITIIGLGQDNIVHGVLGDFVVTPDVEVREVNGVTTVNIKSLTMDYADSLSHGSKTAVDLISSLKWMNRIILDNEDNHLVDIKNDNLYELNGVWIKGFAAGNAFIGNFDTRIDQKYFGINGGYDYKMVRDNGTFYAGIMGNYTTNDNDFNYGTGDIKNIGAGLYGTYMSNNGQYANVKLSIGKYTGDFAIVDANSGDVTAEFDTLALAISGEYGHRQNYSNNLYFEPFIKMTVSSISGFNYEADNGMTSDIRNSASAVFNFGATVGKNLSNGKVYVGASMYQDVTNEEKVTIGNGVASINEKAKVTPTWFKTKLGANFTLSNNLALNLEGAMLFGGGMSSSWTANTGIYLKF